MLKAMEKVYGDVLAAFRYGSQVCGYAGKLSDHDVLVVLESYEPGVKYTYVEDEGVIAFLGVSREVLEEDVRWSAYGGFVADRLINPIEPLLGTGYIRAMEVERKRVIVELETEKVVRKAGAIELLPEVNILYYPYSRWRWMTRIYPPLRYSVESMLKPELREGNLKRLLPGFKEALSTTDCVQEVYPGWYRVEERFAGEVLSKGFPRFERLRLVEREAEDVIARYLAHKKAGDSDMELILKELLSKVRRELWQLRAERRPRALIDPERFLLSKG